MQSLLRRIVADIHDDDEEIAAQALKCLGFMIYHPAIVSEISVEDVKVVLESLVKLITTTKMKRLSLDGSDRNGLHHISLQYMEAVSEVIVEPTLMGSPLYKVALNIKHIENLQMIPDVGYEKSVLQNPSSDKIPSIAMITRSLVALKGCLTLAIRYFIILDLLRNSIEMVVQILRGCLKYSMASRRLSGSIFMRYAKALSVVEPLFQNRGPIDRKTALNICLLLLDVGLACHDAKKSAVKWHRSKNSNHKNLHNIDSEGLLCAVCRLRSGHVYAAEALCLLNRPKDAAEHLLTYLSGANNVELPFTEEDF
ncbi:hypothetical protein J5N97_000533 [Dioscorea zingiberensis]|uniref:Telomere-associated protein Rif1 N-terminal domain-containing protein n=1 Tax=Dioscorea zingiberensis TaxID=325984 RepID=A0A9D5H1A1_9LILI|nr:hypothetical protein J5N97_000533 [Dioscorea zingiberensis]